MDGNDKGNEKLLRVNNNNRIMGWGHLDIFSKIFNMVIKPKMAHA